MKKFYTLALALIGSVALAQTPLNTNGSLEDWPDAMVAPEGWFMTQSLLDNGTISKVTGDAQDGDISVKITAPTSSNNSAGVADIPVTAGETYSVSFWYKTGDTAKFRFWGQWRDDNAALQNITDENFLPNNTYVENATSEWTYMEITSTAPTGATILRPSFRNYNGGSDLFIDNVTLVEGSFVSVKDNSIAGLSVYPNPLSGNTLYVTSNNSIEKSVAIFDVLGKQVANTTTLNGAVNLNLNAGVYIVKITEEGKTATRKLVVR
ncbi:MAG: T9SS type A sorting domain-containing protein [Flavobacteriaceae bacterium]